MASATNPVRRSVRFRIGTMGPWGSGAGLLVHWAASVESATTGCGWPLSRRRWTPEKHDVTCGSCESALADEQKITPPLDGVTPPEAEGSAMGSPRVNIVHLGGPGWDTVACGVLARARRKSFKPGEVTCEACRASRAFRGVERAQAKRHRYQERCGSTGHQPARGNPGQCSRCGLGMEVAGG